jgi:hypothetical protein
MRTQWMLLLGLMGVIIPLQAQTPSSPAPQTARQALIEMFLSNDADAVIKHLPESARKVLLHNGEPRYASTISYLFSNARQMLGQVDRMKTFDDGPNLLVSEQNQNQQEIEVAVEHDIVSGETDEIELSVHNYRDGHEEFLPVVPRFIFVWKQEKQIWRLIDLTASTRVPLTDPGYLQGLLRRQQEANESSAQMRIMIIANVEAAYIARHPEKGYSCTLKTLFTIEPTDENFSDENEITPQTYYEPGHGNTEWSGYRFTLAGCEGSPASGYQITAVPVDSDSGTKSFCADESRTVKSVDGENLSACFAQGEVVSSPQQDMTLEPIQE